MKRTFSDQTGSWCRFFAYSKGCLVFEDDLVFEDYPVSGDHFVRFSTDARQQERQSDQAFAWTSDSISRIATFRTIFLKMCLCCFACFFMFANSAYSEDADTFTNSEKTETTAKSLRITQTLLSMQEVCKAVVNIEGDRKQIKDANTPDEVVGKAYNGMGTGMIIDPRGYIVTNNHVIVGLDKIKVQTFDQAQILDPKKKKYYIGTIVAQDEVTDLAIIKINGEKPFTPIKIGVSAEIIWGEDAYAIGNPYGYPFTITRGIISGLYRDVEVDEKLTYAKAIQTDVAINPGNSGGPLLNADGEVIGINAAIRSGTENIAFAIPIDQVVDVATKLILHQTGRSVYHGLRLKKVGQSGQILVESVEPGSPAEKAGIQTNDLLLAGNQIEFHRPLDFARSLLGLKTNDALSIILMRDGQQLETNIQLIAAKPKYYQGQQSQLASNGRGNGPSSRLGNISRPAAKMGSQVTLLAREREERAWNHLGIKFTTIPMDIYKRQYAQYLSDYPDGAIRISSIRPNSPMYNCGIEPGDMVFTIDNYASNSEERVDAIILELQKNKKAKKVVKVMLNRPRPHEGLAADGYFYTDLEL